LHGESEEFNHIGDLLHLVLFDQTFEQELHASRCCTSYTLSFSSVRERYL